MKAGRKEIKVFVYYADGSRHSNFKNQTEFANHFSIDKNYLSTNRKIRFGEDIVPIYEMDLYATNKPIGRDRVSLYVRKLKSTFIRKNDFEDFEIDCLNLEGEVIATFKSIFHLKALLGRDINISEKHNVRGELTFLKKNNYEGRRFESR